MDRNLSSTRLLNMRAFAQRVLVPIAAVACMCAGTPGEPAGVRNFHAVDDHVYRGAQPTPAGFKSLAKMGVRTVIDLRGGRERTLDEEKLVKDAGMRYVHIPMAGMSAPTDQQIASMLALLNDSTNWPLFVHCRRGADRTGTVIACYRIAHYRWDNRKALEEAKMDGMSMIERAMEHYILTFKPPVDVASHPADNNTPFTTATPAGGPVAKP